MNSNKRKLTEREVEEFREKWQQPLRTVYAKNDIEAIVAAIRADECDRNVVPTATTPDALTALSQHLPTSH